MTPTSMISKEITSQNGTGIYRANYRIYTVSQGHYDPRVLPYYHPPNIQTSLAVVNRLKLMDSGAIHLIGNRVTEAVKKQQIKKRQCGRLMFFFLTRKPCVSTSRTFVVLFILDVSGQTKVSQLYAVWAGN